MALLLCVAILWGTESLPLSLTNLLVATIFYIFAILPKNAISQAYMKDAVFFIAGVLCVAMAVGATGLDRRVGLLVLGKIKGVKSYCFIFFPLIAVTAGFFSEHALCAIFTPILMLVYKGAKLNNVALRILRVCLSGC